MSYIALDGALAQLTGAVGIGATSIPVTTGKGALFEVGSNHSYVTFESATETETVKITGRSTDSLTVLPTTKAWNIGDIIECRPCAQAMADYAVGPQIDTAAAKATPVDADKMGILDSAASFALKYVTWANIKATLWAAFGGATSKATPVDADALSLYDSAATTTQSKLTWANLKATLVATINTWSAKQLFTGTMKVQQALEKITITAAAPSATQDFDWLTQAIQYFTTAGANNWTLNVRGDSGTTLDSLMAVGECATITVQATMTGTPYYASAMTIDGNAVTPKWVGGTAPTSGDASCINIYTYSITKTAAATFTVIASKAKTS